MRNTKRFAAVVLVMAMALSVIFTGCGSSSAPEMKISIEGYEFSPGCKISEIMDAGFTFADTDHVNTMMKESPVIPARTVVTGGVYIFRNGKPSHVAVYVYNKTVNDMDFRDCSVYSFKYDAGVYAQDAADDNCLKVLFNGIDMRFTDRKKVIEELENQGFKFNDDKKTDFFKDGDAYSSYLISATNTGGRSLTITNDYNYESGTRFVNGFECKIKVSYDTSGA
ncbi:MAG: hypothetical protein IKS75_04430 [Clostridiales bacterium]|nr:hypothetical protein [Clostridiales bacterium]